MAVRVDCRRRESSVRPHWISMSAQTSSIAWADAVKGQEEERLLSGGSPLPNTLKLGRPSLGRSDADSSNSVSATPGASHPRSSSTSFPRRTRPGRRLRCTEELCDRVGQRQEHLAGDAGQADAPRRQDGTQETDARHREPCLSFRLFSGSNADLANPNRAHKYLYSVRSIYSQNEITQLTRHQPQRITSLLTEVGSSLPTRHTARLATHGTESSSGSLRKRRTSFPLSIHMRGS